LNYFTACDLEPDVWNDIHGLEVIPLMSPHPLETNILLYVKVETIDTRARTCNTLSAGALVGEISALTGTPSPETYLARSFVHALEMPSSLYLYFVKKNGLYDELLQLQEKRRFLQKTSLFGEALSYSVENRLARAMEPCFLPTQKELVSSGQQDLFLVGDGIVHLYLEDDLLEVLHSGDFWGEGGVLFNTLSLYLARAAEEAVIHQIPGGELLTIPLVRWKLFEAYSRRTEMFFNPGLMTSTIFPMARRIPDQCGGNG
jgi:hemerythrin